MVNKEGLDLLSVLIQIENAHWNKDEKVDLPTKVVYAIAKNISKLKKVQKGFDELFTVIRKEFHSKVDFNDERFQKDQSYKKKIEEAWQELKQTEEVKELISDFYKADAEVDIHYVKDTEGCVLPSWQLEVIETYLVKKDEKEAA